VKPGESNKLYLLHILQTLFGTENVIPEHRFHPVRRWRFDYAVPSIKLSCEYDGHGGFVGKGGVSRHGSITGMTGDCEKFNQARIHGWTVLRFTALHFTAKTCAKHNLTHPKETIMQTIAAMQMEKERLAALVE
jgi:very-short-patch-repair endonuclease